MKSTIIYHGLTFLLLNILLYHFISNIARADCQISSGPKVSAPKLLSQMRKLRQQNPRAYTFQSLHNLADILSRTIRYEHMNMITGNLSRDDVKFMLDCDLPQNIPGSDSNLARQYPFAVLRNPNQMDFKIGFGVCSKFITSHSDIL